VQAEDKQEIMSRGARGKPAKPGDHFPSPAMQKESAMNEKDRYECGICYFQGSAKEFTPITVSANFQALECPKCLNNDEASFEEVKKAKEEKAA
jgi:hypothetical protein